MVRAADLLSDVSAALHSGTGRQSTDQRWTGNQTGLISLQQT
jgi:hypothetical protein